MNDVTLNIGNQARNAARELALASTSQKNAALISMAKHIRANAAAIQAANDKDVTAAKTKDLKSSFIDRLTLNTTRIEAMAQGLQDIAALDDPVGRVQEKWVRPNGMEISRVLDRKSVV